jgi:hypothetical protein
MPNWKELSDSQSIARLSELARSILYACQVPVYLKEIGEQIWQKNGSIDFFTKTNPADYYWPKYRFQRYEHQESGFSLTTQTHTIYPRVKREWIVPTGDFAPSPFFQYTTDGIGQGFDTHKLSVSIVWSEKVGISGPLIISDEIATPFTNEPGTGYPRGGPSSIAKSYKNLDLSNPEETKARIISSLAYCCNQRGNLVPYKMDLEGIEEIRKYIDPKFAP